MLPRTAPSLRVALVDNYDSFSFNLFQLLSSLGASVRVFKNDDASMESIAAAHAVMLSPGPGTPADAGICRAVVEQLGTRLPILGVCLGHQVIAECFGARVERAQEPKHGVAEAIFHDGDLFRGLPSPFSAARYNSLSVRPSSLPACLKVTAWSESGEVMAVQHAQHPVNGIQFHPESHLSEYGAPLLENWLACVRAVHSSRVERPLKEEAYCV